VAALQLRRAPKVVRRHHPGLNAGRRGIRCKAAAATSDDIGRYK